MSSNGVTHFITSLEGGGAQRALATLLCSTRTREHTIYYIHGGPYVQTLRDAGYRVEQVRGWLHPYDPFLFIRLFLLLRRERPAVLHTSLVVANVLGRVLGWLLRIPVVCDLHSDVRFHGRLRNFFERLTARLPARYIAVSKTVRDAFLQEMRGVVPAKRVTVIYNGVNVEDIRRRAQPAITRDNFFECHPGLSRIPQEALIIGAVGRLEQIKRYDLLIEAHALLCRQAREEGRPLPHLILLGSGSQETVLREIVAKCHSRLSRIQGGSRPWTQSSPKGYDGQASKGDSNVHFLGWQENVYRYYPLFDCTVFSSDSEGISYALLESLACGTPVVTTHTEREHEVIKNPEQGVVVKPGSPMDLAKEIAGIKKLDPDSAPGKTTAESHSKSLLSGAFSHAVMAAAYERMYETLHC